VIHRAFDRLAGRAETLEEVRKLGCARAQREPPPAFRLRARPERFAGFHWLNPPELVELVEVVVLDDVLVVLLVDVLDDVVKLVVTDVLVDVVVEVVEVGGSEAFTVAEFRSMTSAMKRPSSSAPASAPKRASGAHTSAVSEPFFATSTAVPPTWNMISCAVSPEKCAGPVMVPLLKKASPAIRTVDAAVKRTRASRRTSSEQKV